MRRGVDLNAGGVKSVHVAINALAAIDLIGDRDGVVLPNKRAMALKTCVDGNKKLISSYVL